MQEHHRVMRHVLVFMRPLIERHNVDRTGEFVLGSIKNVKYDLMHIAADLSIDGLTAHVLRGTWATYAELAGQEMAEIATFMGDSEETVRKNYIHLPPEYLSDIVD